MTFTLEFDFISYKNVYINLNFTAFFIFIDPYIF